MLFLSGSDEDVVLVLALLFGAVLEGGDAVTVLFVVVPFTFVLESVGPLGDAEAASLVVLPLSHVRLDDVGVRDIVLADKANVAVRVGRIAS